MKINGLAILPCAGFGTRMGMKINESKEMLPDSKYGFDHIIDYSLDICRQFHLIPLVITREEKTDLIKYLKKKKIKYMLVDHKGEWFETVLKSQVYWLENNYLLLPDTRFQLITNMLDLIRGLEMGNNAVFGVHKVQDPEKWGIISSYSLMEKPKYLKGPQMAWGIIGFKRYYGVDLFSKMRYSKFKLKNVGFSHLLGFEDITRGVK